MQRKSGFPVANCSIKMPDSISTSVPETVPCEDEGEQHQRRQQLINFGHSQWGFNNWSWTVTKQDVDFVDFTNGKYCAGVVAFVSVTVKTLDIHRENIGYSTSLANNKGLALYKSRKCAVTNALRETLLSFGGSFATKLLEVLEANRAEVRNVPPDVGSENDLNVANKPPEPKNMPLEKIRKDSGDGSGPTANAPPRSPRTTPAVKNVPPPAAAALPAAPPVAKAHPMPANLPPAANRTAQASRGPPPPGRAGSNVSFVLQPVMGGVVPPLYAPSPRLAPPPPPQLFPNYYEYSAGPWHFAYESYDRPHGNVNLNFNLPPKNLVVNGRAGSMECKNACARGAEGEPLQYGPPPPNQGCWIKPTIFYDGFWTEQKVKKWVAEQVEKQFPEDTSHKSSSPSAGGAAEPAASKS